jgi:23S rRNA (cytidine1920-2'-O)/16S rRNA (cytidine1409-2'-O)-methyltransferase
VARERLDTELVRRGLVRSREQAQALIDAGQVSVGGVVAGKSATRVDRAAAIDIQQVQKSYVSRGAHKLIGALDAFSDVTVTGARALDIGASTGGFTEVLLERGAAHVVAVDVGYGQLAWPLRSDERVTVQERTNMRTVRPGDLPYEPDLIVADVSFISLRTLLPTIAAVAAKSADLLLMVKPQFEVGREQVGDGVIRDPALRESAVTQVVAAAQALGWLLCGVVASPLPGPKGNVEYFIWLRTQDAQALALDPTPAIARAVEEGPQS